MKKNLKIFFSVLFVMAIVFVAALFVGQLIFFNLNYTKKGIDKIETDNSILSQIGEYEQVYYQTHHENIWLFSSDASVLIAEYTPDNYIAEKKNIENEYIFINSSVSDDFGDVILEEYEFSIGDWDFRACYSDGWQKYSYPQDFRIVGYNEGSQQIAFLDFDDTDLDEISVSMSDFIDDYFDYDFTQETDF